MKRFVDGVDRGQSTLFPECLEDFIKEDNPVRVIDVFVEELDLAELGFWQGRSEGDGAAVIPSIGPREALHLRLSEPDPVEPAASARGWAQCRGDVADRPAGS